MPSQILHGPTMLAASVGAAKRRLAEFSELISRRQRTSERFERSRHLFAEQLAAGDLPFVPFAEMLDAANELSSLEASLLELLEASAKELTGIPCIT